MIAKLAGARGRAARTRVTAVVRGFDKRSQRVALRPRRGGRFVGRTRRPVARTGAGITVRARHRATVRAVPLVLAGA